MKFALIISLVVSDAPFKPWLLAKQGLEQVFPAGFRGLLQSPDRVVVEGLEPEDKAAFGPDEVRAKLVWTRVVTGPSQTSLLNLISVPGNWNALDHRRCAPNRCFFVARCGGFRPSFAVRLEKGTRWARMLLCLGCGEAWVDLFDADGRRVGREQVQLDPPERWKAVFRALSPPGFAVVPVRLEQVAGE